MVISLLCIKISTHYVLCLKLKNTVSQFYLNNFKLKKIETIQNETQREKRLEKKKRIEHPRVTGTRSHIHVIQVPQGGQKQF